MSDVIFPITPNPEPRRVLSDAATKVAEGKLIGGTHSHKPGCRCFPCKARRRQAKTNPGAAGELAILDAQKLLASPDARAMKGSEWSPEAKARAVVAQWIALRTQDPDITYAEAAPILGIDRRTLSKYIQTAVKEGWLVLHDMLDRVEHEIVPMAMDGLAKLLEDDDKTAIIEVAKNFVAPIWKESKGIKEATNTVIALKIEMPDGLINPDAIATGTIIGKPRTTQVIDIDPISSNEA